MRKIIEEGLDLIKRFEGFSATPYLCPAGIWTNGYGHTAGVTKDSPPITQQEALGLLASDVRSAQASVLRLITVPLSDNQFAALVSFVFNLGGGRLQASTLRRVINRGWYSEAPLQFKRWVYASGVKTAGLVRRRQAEADLFMSADIALAEGIN